MIARTMRVLGRALAPAWPTLVALALAGCGESGTPAQVAPEAKKALDHRKVEAPKSPKGAKPSATSRR